MFLKSLASDHYHWIMINNNYDQLLSVQAFRNSCYGVPKNFPMSNGISSIDRKTDQTNKQFLRNQVLADTATVSVCNEGSCSHKWFWVSPLTNLPPCLHVTSSSGYLCIKDFWLGKVTRKVATLRHAPKQMFQPHSLQHYQREPSKPNLKLTGEKSAPLHRSYAHKTVTCHLHHLLTHKNNHLLQN